MEFGTCRSDACRFKKIVHKFEPIDATVVPILAQECRICGCSAELHIKEAEGVDDGPLPPTSESTEESKKKGFKATAQRKQKANAATMDGVKDRMAFDPGVKAQVEAFEEGKSHRRSTRNKGKKRKHPPADSDNNDNVVPNTKKQKPDEVLNLYVLPMPKTSEVYSGGTNRPGPKEWDSMNFEQKTLRPLSISSTDSEADITASIKAKFCGSGDTLFGDDTTAMNNFIFLYCTGNGPGHPAILRPADISGPTFEVLKGLRELGTNTATRRYNGRIYIALAQGSLDLFPDSDESGSDTASSDAEQVDGEGKVPHPLEEEEKVPHESAIPKPETISEDGVNREVLLSPIQTVACVFHNMVEPPKGAIWWPTKRQGPYSTILAIPSRILAQLDKYTRSGKEVQRLTAIVEECLEPGDLFRSLDFLTKFAASLSLDPSDDKHLFELFMLGDYGLHPFVKSILGLHSGLRTHQSTLPLKVYNAVATEINSLGRTLSTLLHLFQARVQRAGYSPVGFADFFGVMDHTNLVSNLPLATASQEYLLLSLDATTFPGYTKSPELYKRMIVADFNTLNDSLSIDPSVLRRGIHGPDGLLFKLIRFLEHPPILPREERRQEMYDELFVVFSELCNALAERVHATAKADGKKKASPIPKSPRPGSVHTLSSDSEDDETPPGTHYFHFRDDPFDSTGREERTETPTSEPQSEPMNGSRCSFPPPPFPPPPSSSSSRSRPQPQPKSGSKPTTSSAGPVPTPVDSSTDEPPWERLIRDLETQHLHSRGQARPFYENLWRSFSWYPNLQRHPEWAWSQVKLKSDYDVYKIAIRIFHSDKLLPMMRTDDTVKLSNRITHLLLKCKDLNHQ
ncbi:hypothetical protein PM082_009805 [Marasmius tenuissimus]|nr:hypothetical protein PM082_009805 [Marasmius tenuissimus]